MRIAICLSGYVRTLSHTISELARCILDPLNPDLFIQTWSNTGLRGGDTAVTEQFLNQYFAPRAFQILNYDDLKPAFEAHRAHLYAIPGPVIPSVEDLDARLGLLPALSQMWGVYACDILRRNYEAQQGFTYDCVIRARMDSLFKEVLSLEALPDDVILVPDHAGCGGYCDQFAIASSKAMAAYAEFFISFEEVWRSRVLLPVKWATQENLLRRYLDEVCRLRVQRIRFPFELQREDHVLVQSHVTDEWWKREVLHRAV